MRGQLFPIPLRRSGAQRDGGAQARSESWRWAIARLLRGVDADLARAGRGHETASL
jgi:hypothetical protein